VARSAGAIEAGMADARAGIDAAGSGDVPTAAARLRSASDHFASADRSLNAWHARPARLVPVLGQQAGALGDLATVAHGLAGAASRATGVVGGRPVALTDGRVDLDAVAALEPPLRAVEAALARAEEDVDAIGTDWVIPPVRRRHDELRGQVHRARSEARTALDVVRLAPGLLGSPGPRRYFIAFTTPAEARGLGGFIGSFAVLEAANGRVELTRHDRIGAIQPARGTTPRPLDAPPDFIARYGSTHPQDVLSDVTQSPDFPTVAAVIRGAYPLAEGGGPLDGVILADPYAIAAVLKLTGPIRVDGLDQPLSADNAAEILLRGQYEQFGDTSDRRIDALEGAAHAAFDALVHVRSVDPARWARALGPVVAQRRLLVNSARPDEQRLLHDLGLDGAFPPVGDDDFFGFTTTNFGNNKIDAYLHRSVDYRTDWDPATGRVRSRATITLRNDAPDHGLPARVIHNRPSARQPDGTNWMAFDFYSPHELVGASLRSGPAGGSRPLVLGRQPELGRNVYRAQIAVPSRSTVTVELDLAGVVPAGEDYRVRWFQQPAVHPDGVSVAVRPADPWAADPAPGQRIEGATASRSFPGDRDGVASFAASR
jgi:hypothetical protein